MSSNGSYLKYVNTHTGTLSIKGFHIKGGFLGPWNGFRYMLPDIGKRSSDYISESTFILYQVWLFWSIKGLLMHECLKYVNTPQTLSMKIFLIMGGFSGRYNGFCLGYNILPGINTPPTKSVTGLYSPMLFTKLFWPSHLLVQ